MYAAFSKNLSGWSGRFQRRPCGELRSLRAFKAGALAVIGDSGRFSRQVPSFSGGVFGDSGRFAGSIFWNRPSFADHHTRPEDRVFLSFPKAPPFARWGLGAELTWPAPKKTIPLDPLQTDFLESQRIRGFSDCSPLGRPAGRHPGPPSGDPRPGGNKADYPPNRRRATPRAAERPFTVPGWRGAAPVVSDV